MIFNSVIGHQTIVENLKRVLKENLRRSPSLLFAGPSGVGKKLVALAWAQGLLCQEKQPPCGRCSSCKRVAALQHPDLMILAPTESPTLKIEQVRDIQNFVSLKSYEGHSKVVIIDEAQTLTVQASNALLKTLEEPPQSAYFILVTSNRGALLSTIQSRCIKVLFGSLTTSELKKIVPDIEDWALPLAQGRADTALKFLDENYKKLRLSAIKALKSLPQSRIFEGFTYMGDLSDERDSALFAVQYWGQVVKSSLAIKLGANPALSPDDQSVSEELIKYLSGESLAELGQKILRLEQDIQANINKNLAFEKFWIDASTLMKRGLSQNG